MAPLSRIGYSSIFISRPFELLAIPPVVVGFGFVSRVHLGPAPNSVTCTKPNLQNRLPAPIISLGGKLTTTVVARLASRPSEDRRAEPRSYHISSERRHIGKPPHPLFVCVACISLFGKEEARDGISDLICERLRFIVLLTHLIHRHHPSSSSSSLPSLPCLFARHRSLNPLSWCLFALFRTWPPFGSWTGALVIKP